MTTQDSVFPALLRYWRHCRGMSQLDLSTTADISARHLSYLETGRARPSREMVLRLATTLNIPLREQNAVLHAAGFAAAFLVPDLDELLDGPIGDALSHMLRHHEPYPLLVLDRHHNIVKMNRGGSRLLGMFLSVDAEKPLNASDLVFDPDGARPYIENWEDTARVLIERLHREQLLRPNDDALSMLVARLMAYPDVPASFRDRDYSAPSDPVFTLRLSLGQTRLAFFTTVTAFQAPQNVTLDEVLIESYFPLDDATGAFCRAAAQDADAASVVST